MCVAFPWQLTLSTIRPKMANRLERSSPGFGWGTSISQKKNARHFEVIIVIHMACDCFCYFEIEADWTGFALSSLVEFGLGWGRERKQVVVLDFNIVVKSHYLTIIQRQHFFFFSKWKLGFNFWFVILVKIWVTLMYTRLSDTGSKNVTELKKGMNLDR